jgi:hypothetical protein
MIRPRHITHEQVHSEVDKPYLPLLVVHPADLHPFPIRSYGIALLLDTSLAAKGPQDTHLSGKGPQDTHFSGKAPQDTHFPAKGTVDTPFPAKAALDALIRGDHPFLILAGPHLADDLFEYITLCLFSPGYIRVGDAPVIAFHSSPPAGLITRLQQQGWPEIVQWNVPPIHRLTQRREIPGIIDLLLTGASVSGYVFIHGKDLDDTLSLEQSLHRHCSHLLNDNPSLQALLKQRRQLQDSLEAMEKDNRILHERLHNAETTIGIIRNKYKDDYDILFNWYLQEYEVLPLWYKRFGHLIKVLTGKRTAKSLFRSIHRRLHRWKAINPQKSQT